MPNDDHVDPKLEEAWVLSMRKQVEDYLCHQNVEHGMIGDWPAWHVSPITSIWAIESKSSPGWVGWWVIGGDHPMDYISSETARHPRTALRAFCVRWREVVQYMKRGVPHPSIRLGEPRDWRDLVELLETRTGIFERWAVDSGAWGYDEVEFDNS